MSRPVVTTVTLASAVANGICQVQSLAAAGPLVLNGSLVNPSGVAVLDAARQIAIGSSGNDSGITFTVTGTSRAETNYASISQTIAGSNGGTAVTTNNFLTVTSITASGPVAGTVTVGTNGNGSGPWVVWNNFATNFVVGIYGNTMSGAPTWQVDYTYDDVFGTWLPSNVPVVRAIALSAMTGLTGNADGSISGTTVRATRLTITAGPGSVQLTQIQQGG